MKIGVEKGNQWLSKTITTSLTGVNIGLEVNEQIKLAIVTFSSRATSSDGTFTLPNDVIPVRATSAALSHGGYLGVAANSTSGAINNSAAYSVGELVFPIL